MEHGENLPAPVEQMRNGFIRQKVLSRLAASLEKMALRLASNQRTDLKHTFSILLLMLSSWKEVNESNIGVHLDTFHMNIEEKNFYDPIVATGKLLCY